MTQNLMTPDELVFLEHSNWIEGEYSDEALDDAVTAWGYLRHGGEPMISYESVMHTHYLLMQRLRPDIAGKLRDCDVWIGGQRKIFISQALLEEEIRRVCMSIICSTTRFQQIKDLDTAIAQEEPVTRQLHVEFEGIHPHQDGNGRTGRMLMNAHRIRLGLPILIIREEAKFEYYKWFQ